MIRIALLAAGTLALAAPAFAQTAAQTTPSASHAVVAGALPSSVRLRS